MVEGDPLEDDPPWEVKSVVVEEAGEEWMMAEEVDDWKVVEEVAYYWSCLRRSGWRNFDTADYLYESDDADLPLAVGSTSESQHLFVSPPV